MSIKILHLFHDLMNMYGDYGNVSMLAKALDDLGMDVEVDKKSAGDVLFEKDYDFIYCGAGTELKRDKALGLLKTEKDALKKAIEGGTWVLFTGNSWEMLGKSIRNVDGEDLEGLGFFDYVTVETDTRITSDVIAEADFLDKPVCGFINKCGSTTATCSTVGSAAPAGNSSAQAASADNSSARAVSTDNNSTHTASTDNNSAHAASTDNNSAHAPSAGVDSPLFKNLKLADGNSAGDKCEGYHYKNFCGTELIGPLLVKNPHMMRVILKSLCGDKYKDIYHESAEKAYEVTINALSERL